MGRRLLCGLVVMVLLGLSGCMPASRRWVQEQLAPMQAQMAELRQRVAAVEQQLGHLDTKVDRILAQMEQQWAAHSLAPQHPAGTPVTALFPAPSPAPEQLPVEVSLDFVITDGTTPLGAKGPPLPLAPEKVLPPILHGLAAEPDCWLETFTGEPC